jgi:WASH complex subunit strumpellin
MRIINFNVEQECNVYRRVKVQFSRYQNDFVPIPTFSQLPNDNSITFIGRLAREILRITDTKNTIYVDLLTTWYDIKTHQEIIDQKFANKLLNVIQAHGMNGLDKLYCFMITDDLDNVHKKVLKQSIKEKQWTETFQKFKIEIETGKTRINTKMENPFKAYQPFITKCNKGLPNITNYILSIGHKVIWRNHIAHELVTSSKINCRSLVNSLSATNE